jgi:peptidoglycan/xylan/chitin deacetylase (PgdA/CDA1 family)
VLFIHSRHTPTGATAEPEGSVPIPIIMYHEIKTYKTGKDVITPYEFESDLKYLTGNNYHTITMTELINYVYEKKPLPENPIILSFDDGYLSTYKYAYPLLKKYNMKIVFSIIGKKHRRFYADPGQQS